LFQTVGLVEFDRQLFICYNKKPKKKEKESVYIEQDSTQLYHLRSLGMFHLNSFR
jgi:hypothetical protein